MPVDLAADLAWRADPTGSGAPASGGFAGPLHAPASSVGGRRRRSRRGHRGRRGPGSVAPVEGEHGASSTFHQVEVVQHHGSPDHGAATGPGARFVFDVEYGRLRGAGDELHGRSPSHRTVLGRSHNRGDGERGVDRDHDPRSDPECSRHRKPHPPTGGAAGCPYHSERIAGRSARRLPVTVRYEVHVGLT